MKKKSFATLVLLLGAVIYCSAQNGGISMFPKAAKGQKQAVIQLKKMPDEKSYKIELYAGKMAEVDNCNTFSLSGSLKENNLKGWGYKYYTFTSNSAMIGTRMACKDKTKIKKFIAAQSLLVRYNSKLPIVVYIPDGYEVRYKIWSTNNQENISTIVQ